MPARRITKVLIANRGEIACRVIRACRELDLRTVAVHSDADAAALHVRLADEAVAIGPPPARESYLRADKIVDAIKKTGADAVHPGYGFLSENADFAEAVAAAGATFIGPPPAAIRAMGGKTAARALMQARGRAGRPRRQRRGRARFATAAAAKAAAARIGYPVMLKAAAGGGGRGMRLVDGEDKLEAALAGAQREAKAAFGDDTIYIEKAIVRPRHIEIQVFGDEHGGAVHLYERDCSIQRRNQKVIEESPSPAIDDEPRARMGEVAVRAARSVGYVGAGTIEMLFDAAARSFYFLEMNTRLQVEHPITELVTASISCAGRSPSRRASAPAGAGGDPAARRRHRVPRLRRGSGEVPAVARDDHVAARAVGPGRARRLGRRRGQRHLRPLRPDDLEAGACGPTRARRRSSGCGARSASTTSAASARTCRSTAR